MTSPPLHLDTASFRKLLQLQGPSLGLWRAAEIAVLRQQKYDRRKPDLASRGRASVPRSQVQPGNEIREVPPPPIEDLS
ncbi:hypothetical protein [Floridanema aerugineum]|uniref:Uncharacterized protein n=1 Tax=Floridaenema aerugineum BLCC-F46 TaxID=3153654 RepID=A0ABV4X994_9CYAN